MLNKNNERELAYVVTVDAVTPIEGADRVEQAVVGGWHIMTRKGQFKPGDPAIYFEIDSKVPETEPFKFLESKNYKVKTQKYFKGTVISQGLLMSAEDFGWHIVPKCEPLYSTPYIVDDESHDHHIENESRFLTEKLGVKYAVEEDNVRKAASADKYKKMAQRHGKLFSHQPFRWLMKRTWGKKLLFLFFGKKKDKTGWPAWVSKTDEERVQNMPWILEDKNEWIATEKIDGTSTTFTLKRGHGFKKDEFYVCSRNVAFTKDKKDCYYDSNVYLEMAEKYHIYEKMSDLLHNHFFDCDWITIQGETYGEGIQRRDYSTKEHNFMAFNFITSKDGRWDTIKMQDLLEKHCEIPCVPIVDSHFILPDTVDELLEYATGSSVVDGKMREGIVFRYKDGSKSFKAVSNEFLLKYHQ